MVAKISERDLGIVGKFLVWKKFLEERVVVLLADRVELEVLLLLRRGVLHLRPEDTGPGSYQERGGGQVAEGAHDLRCRLSPVQRV
jgi:hypothetical protein